MPRLVGLTGGIGSGKSHVRDLFGVLGVTTLDADIIARDIHQDPTHAVLPKLCTAFGDILTTDGRMDRLKMRVRLNTDQTANQVLKSLLKPYVIHAVQQTLDSTDAVYIVLESALLLEEHVKVDRVLVVDCDVDTQIQRVTARNPTWSHAHIVHMMGLQLSREERLRSADDVVNNDGERLALETSVHKLHMQYTRMWG